MKQRLILRTADRKHYVEELLRLGSLGAVLVDFPGIGVIYSATVEVEVERGKEYKSTPTLHAIPLPIDTFSKEQMEAMVWEDFREACATLGVKGRERAVMLQEYLGKAAHYLAHAR